MEALSYLLITYYLICALSKKYITIIVKEIEYEMQGTCVRIVNVWVVP